MDASHDRINEEKNEIVREDSDGDQPVNTKKRHDIVCGWNGCKHVLTKQNRHTMKNQRVCEKCWTAHGKKRKRSFSPSSSSSSCSSSSSSISHLPNTRSVLPPLPTTFSFATHDWEITQSTPITEHLAQEWMVLIQSERVIPLKRGYIQGSNHHSQFSVLTERHHWRELDRLAHRTETVIRNKCEEVLGIKAHAFKKLHLVAFKVLESDSGYGLQQYHYDVEELEQANEMVSVIGYLHNTMSTELPLHNK